MRFDVMMPFYGDVGLFQMAVDSVRAQSYDDWRLVVIDDCYPDSAPREYLETLDDPRIEYVRNARNLGVAGNFQRAADLATAERTIVMGCDDIMLPGYLARLRDILRAYPDATAVQPGVLVVDETGRRVSPLADRVKAALRPRGGRVLRGEELARSLLRGDWTYFPSLCWATSFLRSHPFRADFEVVLDLDVKVRIAFDGGTLAVDDEPVFLYRRHSSSVSSAKAVDGSRFEEEAAYFSSVAAAASALGWRRAAGAARHHLTSRLNALTRMPAAIMQRDRTGLRVLARHATGIGRGARC